MRYLQKYADATLFKASLTPEQRLMFAILERAIDDLRVDGSLQIGAVPSAYNGGATMSPVMGPIHDDAMEWIMSDEERDASFLQICAELKLDVRQVRLHAVERYGTIKRRESHHENLRNNFQRQYFSDATCEKFK